MNPKHTSSKFLAAQRKKGGGVALVEAGILAPIFAMMMMMTVYLGGVYQKKYISTMKSRDMAFTKAAAGCTTGDSQPGFGGSEPNVSGGANNPSGKAMGSESAATSNMFFATGKDTETWDYEPTYKFNGGGPKSVTSLSYVMCNEPQRGYAWPIKLGWSP